MVVDPAPRAHCRGGCIKWTACISTSPPRDVATLAATRQQGPEARCTSGVAEAELIFWLRAGVLEALGSWSHALWGRAELSVQYVLNFNLP